MEKVVLKFTDFWTGFNRQSNFFKGFFENELGLKVQIAERRDYADIEFVSTFHYSSKIHQAMDLFTAKFSDEELFRYTLGKKHGNFIPRDKKNSELRIWYSGENFRYAPDSADGYLCFDKSDDSQNVLYFPYWMYRLDWGFNTHEFLEQVVANKPHQPRPPELRRRNVCMFSNTREPGKMRVLKAVDREILVEKYGRAFGNPVENKYEISKSFGLQICPENTIYPGYVTEKLIEAWHCGNVPIWQGIDSNLDFNPEAIIDVTHLTLEEISEMIRNIDDNQLTHMRSLNILRKPPSLSHFKNFIQKLMNLAL